MPDPCTASPLPILTAILTAFGEPNVYVTGRHWFNTARQFDPFELFVEDSEQARATLTAIGFSEIPDYEKDSMTAAVFTRACGPFILVVECVSELARKLAARDLLFAHALGENLAPSVWSMADDGLTRPVE